MGKNPVTRFLVTPLRRYPLRVLLTTVDIHTCEWQKKNNSIYRLDI